MSFNFWETNAGKSIDQYTTDIKKWMYAMLAMSTALVVIGIIKLFKRS